MVLMAAVVVKAPVLEASPVVVAVALAAEVRPV
jgi:hypothetical protein